MVFPDLSDPQNVCLVPYATKVNIAFLDNLFSKALVCVRVCVCLYMGDLTVATVRCPQITWWYCLNSPCAFLTSLWCVYGCVCTHVVHSVHEFVLRGVLYDWSKRSWPLHVSDRSGNLLELLCFIQLQRRRSPFYYQRQAKSVFRTVSIHTNKDMYGTLSILNRQF